MIVKELKQRYNKTLNHYHFYELLTGKPIARENVSDYSKVRDSLLYGTEVLVWV